MSEPAYTRLNVDERRLQIVDAGKELFTNHAYEEISMREIAEAAGISKALLYHYFPSKIDLFKAAVAEASAELQSVIEPVGQGAPAEQLAASLDAYLGWIEQNAVTWAKLMQSAATLPEAREIVEGFRAQTMQMVLTRLSGRRKPRPALRAAVTGWLGYMDAAIIDWAQHGDLPRDKLRDLLVAAFGATLLAAQHIDPRVKIEFT
ncbi:MAG TPA: TetR/AcrR family transcriptional regulator [Solirubrobacteraceae bacterium]|jgi:AcrR family transcriptional regulator